MLPFYALLSSGVFLLGGAAIITAKANFLTFLFFKIIPALLGIWCLWEAALMFMQNSA